MEAFGRYGAGPLALASLAWNAWNAWNSNEVAGVVLWCLAATWAVAAVLAWRRERLTLKQRVILVADRVRYCRPRWWKLPDYQELVVEVMATPEPAHRRVRWSDGHESIFFPSSDARVETVTRSS